MDELRVFGECPLDVFALDLLRVVVGNGIVGSTILLSVDAVIRLFAGHGDDTVGEVGKGESKQFEDTVLDKHVQKISSVI